MSTSDRSAHCPRDSSVLEAFARHPTAATTLPTVVADICRRCNGVWYDASELPAVNAALARVHAQPAEIFRDEVRATAACPRCLVRMRQFSFLAIELDYCAACRGVWVDGDEHEALARVRATELDATLAHPHRDRAGPDAIFLGRVRCVDCTVELPLRESVMTAAGVSCAPCAHTREVEGGDVGAAPPAPRDWGAWAFLREVGGAVGALLSLMLAQHYCARCGRPAGSCLHG